MTNALINYGSHDMTIRNSNAIKNFTLYPRENSITKMKNIEWIYDINDDN